MIFVFLCKKSYFSFFLFFSCAEYGFPVLISLGRHLGSFKSMETFLPNFSLAIGGVTTVLLGKGTASPCYNYFDLPNDIVLVESNNVKNPKPCMHLITALLAHLLSPQQNPTSNVFLIVSSVVISGTHTKKYCLAHIISSTPTGSGYANIRSCHCQKIFLKSLVLPRGL